MKSSTQKHYIALLFIVSIIILFACKKGIQSNPGDGDGSGTVQGVITDLNNSPVSNATVTGGTATATTDASGKFTLTKVQFNSDTVVVIVTKDGFFEGSKNFVSGNSTVSNAIIQLIPKPASGSFSAASGGNVTITGGGLVNFGSGFITADNGSAYSGSVSVSAHYLDPGDANFSAYAPGSLKAVNPNNPQGTLQSFGVVAVEMNDAAGNKLQLASGKTATITIPIPSALQGSAPSSTPLWYFDVTKGTWKQEGSATKQGNNYIGVVSHFTFWNAGDIAGSLVNLSATFIDTISGAPFANKLVTIMRPDSSSKNSYTDNSGKISGLVPANEVLFMNVLDTCGVAVYSKTIGPFSANTDLGTIIVHYSQCNQPDTYIILTLPWLSYSWVPASDSLYGDRVADTSGSFYTHVLGGGDPWVNRVKSISFNIYSGNNTAPGNYPVYLFTTLNDTTYTSSFTNQYNLTTNVTEYGAVNGYITGTISGNMALYAGSGSSNPVIIGPFSCSYRVKRRQ